VGVQEAKALEKSEDPPGGGEAEIGEAMDDGPVLP
jgi:hypothetical protein